MEKTNIFWKNRKIWNTKQWLQELPSSVVFSFGLNKKAQNGDDDDDDDDDDDNKFDDDDDDVNFDDDDDHDDNDINDINSEVSVCSAFTAKWSYYSKRNDILT